MLRANCCYCVFLALSLASCEHKISNSADSQSHKTDNKVRDSASLNYQHHQALTNGPYQAAYIRFNGRLMDKASDGFTVDYDGQMAIDKLVSIQSAE